MNEEVVNDLFQRAVAKGYKKDRNEFVKLLHSNDNVLNDNYDYIKSKGYKKSIEDFSSLIGKGSVAPLKKKEPTEIGRAHV